MDSDSNKNGKEWFKFLSPLSLSDPMSHVSLYWVRWI